jgi:hypothetical protein
VNLDPQPRDLDREVVEQLEGERVSLLETSQALFGLSVDLSLNVERSRDAIRIEEQFQDGPQQFANRRKWTAVGFEERRVIELVVRRNSDTRSDLRPLGSRKVSSLTVANCCSSASV